MSGCKHPAVRDQHSRAAEAGASDFSNHRVERRLIPTENRRHERFVAYLKRHGLPSIKSRSADGT